MSPKSILLTSASGTIGRLLIPHLLSTTPESTRLILPTSSATRLATTYPPASFPRLTITEGPVSDPTWLESLCREHAVDAAFLNLGGTDELFTTLGALDAFGRAGVRHVVYLSCAGEFTSPEGAAAMLKRAGTATVVVKVAVEQRLRYAEMPFKWTVVGPTLFFENDLRTPELLVKEGLLPEPLGEKGVSRVSARDIAAVVAKVIEDGGEKLGGAKMNVGTLRRWTGRETEEVWSKALGREVSMSKGDEEGLEAYERGWWEFVPGAMGKAIGRDVALLCKVWLDEGFGLEEDEYRLLRAVLGRDVEDYGEWVAKMGKELKEGEGK